MNKQDIEQLEKLAGIIFEAKTVPAKEIGKADLEKKGGPDMSDLEDLEEYENPGDVQKEGHIPPQLKPFVKKKGEDKGESKSNDSGTTKPDFADLDNDGDKKEPMKQAAKDKDKPDWLKKIKGESKTMSTFDKLFKSTLNEQSEMMDDEEMNLDVGDEMADEGGEEDMGEEVDIASRIEMIIGDLQSVISEIRGENPEDDLEGLEDEAGEGEDEDTFGEAVSEPEPRELSDSGGKGLMGKGHYKVPGHIKTASGRQDKGKLTNAPEPADFSDSKGHSLQGKGSQKVSASRISQGQMAFD